MKNLARFFHYHEGEPKVLWVKIGSSFVACFMLFILAGALQAQSAFSERSSLLSMLVPELAAPAIAEENAVLEAPATSPAQPPSEQTEQTCSIDGKQVACDDVARLNEERERRDVLEERKGLLREIKDQKRELRQGCNKLKRIKGAESDLAACERLIATASDYEQKIKLMDGSDTDELRDLMNEYRNLNVWDELNLLRFKANLPQELNNFFKDLIRLEKLLKQKAFQKIQGLNFAAINAKVAEIKNLHAEAKACYTAGDFECANEKLNEARESSYPGELEGPLHMLRGIFEQLRQVKSAEVKTEVLALVQPAIDNINEGDWRDARIGLEPLNEEVTFFLDSVIRAQSRSRNVSPDTLNRLQKLLEKYGDNGKDDNQTS